MPTIRIDDEVYRFLQERATPFVDAPNDVLRRLLLDDDPEGTVSGGNREASPKTDGIRRMRRDASGLGDEDRYLRGKLATIYNGDEVYKRSGVRSPRGADLNQLQTWIAELVGLRHPGNAMLIHNLRTGSPAEAIGRVRVTVEPQTGAAD